MDACIDALAGHYASKKQKVWNLGHDVEKWPEEVDNVIYATVFGSLEDIRDKPTDTVEDVADIIGKRIVEGIKELKDKYKVSADVFAYRFGRLIMTMVTSALEDEDAAGIMTNVKAVMKEVEMKEHGYRFAPPQGTTMH